MVKNPPAMWETWVRFPGWNDPLEEAGELHGQRTLVGHKLWGCKSWT